MTETGPQREGDSHPCPWCGEMNLAEREYCRKCFKRVSSRESASLAAAEGKLAAALAADKPAAAPAGAWAQAAAAVPLILITLHLLLAGDRAFIFILDHVNLAFHEAGHIIFGFFGEFIHYLGGTLSQLLWPLVCFFHFRRRGESFSADICLWWTGENLFNIGFYAADAIKQELPLVGGGVHDWTYLLTATGLIAKTELIGRAFALAGAAVCFWAIGRIISRAVRRARPIDTRA